MRLYFPTAIEDRAAILRGEWDHLRPDPLPKNVPAGFASDAGFYLETLLRTPEGVARFLHTVSYLDDTSPGWQRDLKQIWLDRVHRDGGRAFPVLRSVFEMLTSQPLVPRPDNFTSAHRTPWGGKRIREMMRPLGVPDGDIVGEAWVVSSHPSYPSRVPFRIGDYLIEIPLSLIGEADPVALTPFLVKLLHARRNLSVQIHPPEGYRDARGKIWPPKTEAWVILEAEEGAGLYLGLKEGVIRPEMETALRAGGDISRFLNFVPVHPGDVFFLPPGTPHAIGKGILLLEPQQTSESTFRYYDWGRVGADGRPRELHIEDALAVTDWVAPRGLHGVEGHLRRRPVVVSGGDGGFALQESLVLSDEFSLDRFSFEPGDLARGDTSKGMHGLTVMKGQVELFDGRDQKIGVFRAGEAIVLPIKMGSYSLKSVDKSEIYITRKGVEGRV